MIHDVLNFLRDQLNIYFKIKADITEDRVQFIDGTRMDPISFPADTVTPMLMNVEEERTLRPPDLYAGLHENGAKKQVFPEIRLNLFVLFISKFNDYEQSMKFLSLIIQFFQSNRLFDHHSAPTLHKDIEKLIMELITMPFAEQDSIWNALRTTHMPSVLYKVKMIVFKDEESIQLSSDASGMEKTIGRL